MKNESYIKRERGQPKIDNLFHLSGKRDSNPRPSAWEADALPTELLPQIGGDSRNRTDDLLHAMQTL